MEKERKKKKKNSGGRKGETTSWGWCLFNFMLQDSTFSGKPTRHMFEFNFLNCKVKYMLFWILSPNICLVFSTHLFCSSWSTSKSWFVLMLGRLSAECRLVFLKCHQEDGIAGYEKQWNWLGVEVVENLGRPKRGSRSFSAVEPLYGLGQVLPL